MDKAENKSKEFIKQILNIRDYWLNVGKEQNYDSKTIVNGTIFSILVMLDGDSSSNDFHSIELMDEHDGKRIDCGYLHELLGVVEKERTEKEG